MPLMKNPEQQWKASAIGRYRNGDTIRTDQMRFTEYTGVKGSFLARMLYDHDADPSEDVNISEHKESRETVKMLTDKLHEGVENDR